MPEAAAPSTMSPGDRATCRAPARDTVPPGPLPRIRSAAVLASAAMSGCLPGTRGSAPCPMPPVDQPRSQTARAAPRPRVRRAQGVGPRAGQQLTPIPAPLGCSCARAGAALSHASSLLLKSMFCRLCHYCTLFQSSVLLGAV